ncbi:MAG: SpoIIE family protein phosphatase [Bacteroidales bacterium]|nr:SpoIIE family protein phosphatase [Bacteroidales bacterium]
MKNKTVKSGIVKVAVIGVSVMVLCLVFYYIMLVKQQRKIEQLARNDRSVLVDRILTIYSKQYSNIVRDNSAWDEFIESYLGREDNPDEEWLLNNIGYMLENYTATDVCVFDTLGNKVYERKKPDGENIEFYDFGDTLVQDLFHGKPFLDFHLRKNGEIFEYHGARVVHADDMVARVQKPQGYLFMIKRISEAVIEDYREAIGETEIEIVHTQQEVDLAKKAVLPNYLIVKDYKDYNGETVSRIYFVFENSVVGLFKNFVPIFLLVAIMCVLIVIAIVRYAHVKITKPLHNIAEAFKAEKTDKVVPLKKEENEFGVVAGMMEEFFNQKDNLAKLNADLRQSKEEILVQHENVTSLNEELSQINEDLAEQKEYLEKANEQLTSGIKYASRLQSAMLQAVEPTKELFKNFFVIYQPKDIVGGDFYFTQQDGDTVITVLGDCTGHGVPGAVLASMGISFLTQLFLEKQGNEIMPDEILMRLKDKVTSALGLDKDGSQRSDGMDVAMLIYNRKTRNGYFAGAQRPMFLVRDNQIFIIKGDSIPIGHFDKTGKFTAVNIKLQKEDKIYLFSDGCTDQIGGDKKTRLMTQKFKTKILEFSSLEFSQQKKAVEKMLSDWKGDLQQTDDISLLAFEIE